MLLLILFGFPFLFVLLFFGALITQACIGSFRIWLQERRDKKQLWIDKRAYQARQRLREEYGAKEKV